MKTIKIYRASTQNSDSGAAKGTSSNPYTKEEFESMLEAGTWKGGCVEGMGYVIPRVDIMGSSNSFCDSDTDSWSDPWGSISDPWGSSEENTSSQPSGGGGGTGNNNSGNNGPINNESGNNSSSHKKGNTLVIGSHTEISEYSRNLLRNLQGDYGKIVITSTVRSPKAQAKAMLANIKKTGINVQLDLYRNPGDAVIRAYNPKDSDEKNLAAMTAEIYNQGPRKVSKHCMSSEEYKKLNVMDISRGQMKNHEDFMSELKKVVPSINIK